MKTKLFISLLSLFSISLCQAQQQSSPPRDSIWQKIGETLVDFRSLDNEIKLTQEDKFNFIKFSVSEMPVNVTALEVYFVTGAKQEIRVDMKITNDTDKNQNIELYSGERKLSKVKVSYDSIPGKVPTPSVLQLWGMKIQ